MMRGEFMKSIWWSNGLILLMLAVVMISCVPGITSESLVTEGSDDSKTHVASSQEIKPFADLASLYPRPATMKKYPGQSLTTFHGKLFIGSGRCSSCHDLLQDAAGNDVSIVNHWRSTMMANAAKDPLWLAKVASEVARNPAIKQVIESKCATCHMPMAWTQIKADGGYDLSLVDQDGLLSVKSKYHQAAMDGVSCSFCHQIQDENLDSKESFSGGFLIDTKTGPPNRKLFGPYREPEIKAMQTSIGFVPEFAPQINDSALCATCHTLFTPYLDSAGNIAGEFPEQTPYLEWQHSAYNVPHEQRYEIGETNAEGKICQQCHMPHTTGGSVVIAKWSPKELKPRDHFSRHFFVGGNALMLDILADNAANLNLSASTDKLEDTKQRTINQLQTESARLAFVNQDRSGDTLTATLKITNLAGHKFPTGLPARRLWIHFTVADQAGRLVFESGRPMDDGSIAGNDNDADFMSFEPHYDRITNQDQVQIYETIMANSDREVTYTFLRAASYIKDNRLLPDGFDKASASPAIGVYGQAADDANFTGGSDQITYRVDVTGYSGPFTVTAELLFTTVSYSFVQDLVRDWQVPEVRLFSRLFDRANKMPLAVAVVHTKI